MTTFIPTVTWLVISHDLISAGGGTALLGTLMWTLFLPVTLGELLLIVIPLTYTLGATLEIVRRSQVQS